MKARKHTRRTPPPPLPPGPPSGPRSRVRVPESYGPLSPSERFDADLETLAALGISRRAFFAFYSRVHETCIPPVPGTRRNYRPEDIDRAIPLRRQLAQELAALLFSYVPRVRPVAANDALPPGVLPDPRRERRSARHGAPRPESGPSGPGGKAS